MRIVFIGAGKLTVMTARSLLEQKHEVIIIESNKELIDELSGELDCGFLYGDGSRPDLLREAGPEHTDYLFCMTDNDQTNIIATLVGRTLKFKKIITKIDNKEFEHICTELGLENIIVPTRTISRFLNDMVVGQDILVLSTMIKGDARFFSFVARSEDEKKILELELPENARIICFYRDGEFIIAESDMKLKEGDEVIVLTHSKNLRSLREMWGPKNTKEK
ncbi:MAG: potassium channel family protein [Nitrospirota bacterium]